MIKISQLWLLGVLGAVYASTLYAQEPSFIKKYESEGISTINRSDFFDGAMSTPIPKSSVPSVQKLVITEIPITEQERQSFSTALKIATDSPELAALLGDDSRLLSGGVLPQDRSVEKSPAQYKFTYYNYEIGQAIESIVSDGEVKEIKQREQGFQPIPSNQEMRDAIKILEIEMPDFSSQMEPNSVRGITQSGQDGRREIYLFSESNNSLNSVVIDLVKNHAYSANSVQMAN